MSFTFRGTRLPMHVKESLDAYVVAMRPTGSFLRACIENDLARAVMQADEQNMPLIPVIVSYLYNVAPMECWGSREKHDAWLQREPGHAAGCICADCADAELTAVNN